MRILPILFNTEMVRAILDGRKTVTRRLIKPQPQGYFEVNEEPLYIYDTDFQQGRIMPPYQPGDILYVRETWMDYAGRIMYKADCDEYRLDSLKLAGFNWHPSLHMPKEAARIFIKVKDVRVERLQDITEEQAESEGISEKFAMSWWKPTYYDPDSGGYPKYRDTFAFDLWDSTIKKSDLEQYGWNANPWVWVIEFEICEKPE